MNLIKRVWLFGIVLIVVGCSALQKPPTLESATAGAQVPRTLAQQCPEMIAACRTTGTNAGATARQENINKELMYSGGGAAVGAGTGALTGTRGYYGGYYDPYYGYYGRRYYRSTAGRNAAVGAGIGLAVGALASQLTKTDMQAAYDQAFLACIREAEMQCNQKQAALAAQAAQTRVLDDPPSRYHKKKRYHKRR